MLKVIQYPCLSELSVCLETTPIVSSLCSVSGQSRETEAVKLMSVRAGLLDMANAWDMLGNKCSVLAQSQKVCLWLTTKWMKPLDGPEIGVVLTHNATSILCYLCTCRN